MSAKEMFEKLGFEYSRGNQHILYINHYENQYIWFYEDKELIEIEFDIDMNILQAINRQVEELGWK